jgi:hypothetical protein
MLEIMAVALRLQRHRIGDEVMNEAVDFITQRSVTRGIGRVTLQANVHKLNTPSLRVERWGFRYQWDLDDRYRTCAVEILTAA